MEFLHASLGHTLLSSLCAAQPTASCALSRRSENVCALQVVQELRREPWWDRNGGRDHIFTMVRLKFWFFLSPHGIAAGTH